MLLYGNLLQMKTHPHHHNNARGIPEYAHHLIVFFTSSLYIQDTIYTKNTKRGTEQWIEFVVRFYAFDKTKEQKRVTYGMLKKLQSKVNDMMKCAFQFEELLHKNRTSERIEHEKRLRNDWSLLYANMSNMVAKQKGRKMTKCTQKKTLP
jgi:vacuolar-type H+-ATPase subunit B/Vma2